jgi:hypothetical protein
MATPHVLIPVPNARVFHVRVPVNVRDEVTGLLRQETMIHAYVQAPSGEITLMGVQEVVVSKGCAASSGGSPAGVLTPITDAQSSYTKSSDGAAPSDCFEDDGPSSSNWSAPPEPGSHFTCKWVGWERVYSISAHGRPRMMGILVGTHGSGLIRQVTDQCIIRFSSLRRPAYLDAEGVYRQVYDGMFTYTEPGEDGMVRVRFPSLSAWLDSLPERMRDESLRRLEEIVDDTFRAALMRAWNIDNDRMREDDAREARRERTQWFRR